MRRKIKFKEKKVFEILVNVVYYLFMLQIDRCHIFVKTKANKNEVKVVYLLRPYSKSCVRMLSHIPVFFCN